MKKKYCVFCGKIPEKKNNEHIISDWLFSLCNSSKKTVQMSINPISKDNVNYQKLTLPACTKCNSIYGEQLESKSKSIFQKLSSLQSISTDESMVFLDYLDKVRVGVWHLNLIHEKDKSINPDYKFVIENRIRQKDRICLIYTFPNLNEKIKIIGHLSPIFKFMPSVLGLVAKNMLIISISDAFCLAPYLKGMFPKNYSLTNEGGFDFEKEINFSCRKKSKKIPFLSLLPEANYLFAQNIMDTQLYYKFQRELKLNSCFSNFAQTYNKNLYSKIFTGNNKNPLIESEIIEHSMPNEGCDINKIIPQIYKLQMYLFKNAFLKPRIPTGFDLINLQNIIIKSMKFHR